MPPGLVGSPGSFVAPELVPLTVPAVPGDDSASAKLSLAGPAARAGLVAEEVDGATVVVGQLLAPAARDVRVHDADEDAAVLSVVLPVAGLIAVAVFALGVAGRERQLATAPS